MGNTNSFEYKYSVEAEPSKSEELTGVRRAATHPNELVSGLRCDEVHSCWDIFQLGKRSNPDGHCLGRRSFNENGVLSVYEWLSFTQVEDKALRVGTGILDLELYAAKSSPDEPFEGARMMRQLGIFAKNRLEWFICEQAANAFGLTLIPLYDTLGDDAVRFILKDTGLSAVICSADCAEFLLNAVGTNDEDLQLKTIILMDPVTEELEQKSKDIGVKLVAYATLEAWERKAAPTPGSEKNVATLCYTSGTTGNPKGVILSQGNFVACVCGILRGPLSSAKGISVSKDDIHISYLPLAHVFERIICNTVLAKGAAIGVYSGDVTKVLDDMKELKPTVFISVPRVFNRINDKILAGIKDKSALAQFLFNTGMEAKLRQVRTNATVANSLWDTLVFNKTKNLVGGRLRYMLAGGAPLDAVVQDRMKSLFCCPLCEGYGLTETLGASFISSPMDPISGHVGGPIPALEFCLSSVPEMEYLVTANPPCGELLVRGPAVSPGYYNNPEETKKAYDAEGWHHTGDVVVLLPNGGIKIIDRKKNIFKLAQGEYVAPEKIESVYTQCSLVSQVFAFGHSNKFSLVGIVVPDAAVAKRWAEENGHKEASDLSMLCQNENFKKAVLTEMDGIAKSSGLKGFEKLKDVYLHAEAFSMENGLLTPTFKLKRHQAKQRFSKEIDDMYKTLSAK